MTNRNITFIHLDLGIGGAEQLVINLAMASLNDPTVPNSSTSRSHNTVKIYTSNCDQSHCFDEVNIEKRGALSGCVRVRGSFLPDEIRVPFTNKSMGGRALCSTIRIFYLSLCAIFDYWFCSDSNCKGNEETLFVIDVLPTSIPLMKLLLYPASYLKSKLVGILFYCHFPDKHLVRDTINGEVTNENRRSFLRSTYRYILDYAEEASMSHANFVLVNSNFTREVVLESFPRFSLRGVPTKVLYPSINIENFVPPSENDKSSSIGPIVSLNRFERKKNIQLLLEAIKILTNRLPSNLIKKLNVVIAGGYDVQNDENINYLNELKEVANILGVKDLISFETSISDERRAALLQSALCVCYTPHREHFGIVPLEAMYAGSPVVAVKSGGPRETVIDGETGYLVEGTSEAFAEALNSLITNPSKANQMGLAGNKHVYENFRAENFCRKWLAHVDKAMEFAKAEKSRRVSIQFVYTSIGLLVLCFAIGNCYS